MPLLLFAIVLAAHPLLPAEGVRAKIILSSAGAGRLKGYQQELDKKKGPPAPATLAYRLRSLPASSDSEAEIIGMAIFPLDQIEGMRFSGVKPARAPFILPIPHVAPGLWQLTAHLQDDGARVRETLLTGWICLEVKPGETASETTLELSLVGSLKVVVNLDQTLSPDETIPVEVLIRDATGTLVDYVILEMTTASAVISRCQVPQSGVEVQAQVTTDKENVRVGRRAGQIENLTTLTVDLKRPVKLDPMTVPRASGGGLFFNSRAVDKPAKKVILRCRRAR